MKKKTNTIHEKANSKKINSKNFLSDSNISNNNNRTAAE